MKRNFWIVAAVVCLLLAGPAFAGEEIQRSFKFRAGDTLEIETERGDIEYDTTGGSELTITIRAKKGNVEDYLDLRFDDRDGVYVKGDATGKGSGFLGMFGDNEGGNITFLIEGPEQVDLILSTSGGDITLDSIEGTVKLGTSGGDIQFDEIRGSIKAGTSGGDIEGDYVSDTSSLATSGGDISVDRAGADLNVATSGGDIEVDEVEGELEAATSGGNIDVGSARGDVEVSTSGGDITLENMEGFVEARTSGGDMEIEFASGNDRGGELATSGGDMTVLVPRGVGFDLDADADGGEVHAEVSVETEGRRYDDRLQGTISGGGNLLKLRNNHGEITIAESGR